MLTAQQAAALKKARNIYGRTWKSALSAMWMRASYPPCLDGCSLQQVRNALGPAWLYSPGCNAALDGQFADVDAR
jgi:hypothetical protein